MELINFMKKKIWLDAGHGGKDPGACGVDLKEKDITLDIILKIGAILKDYDVDVFYSRMTDTDVTLSSRTTSANNVGADVFVSVHCNSATNTNARGVETYCYKFKYSPLADTIHKRIVSDTSLYKIDRKVKEGDFHVVRETKMSACLVETAFISNDEDRWLLKNKKEEYAKAIAYGILDYLGITVKVPEPPKVESNDSAPLYHVIVGELTSKEEADALAAKLKKEGYNNIMISVTTTLK